MTRVNGDITTRPKDTFKFGHKKKTENCLLTQTVQLLGCPRLGRLTVLEAKLPGPQDMWPPHLHLLQSPLYTRSRNKGPPLLLEQADLGAARASDLRSVRLQHPHAFVAPSVTSGGPTLHLPSPPRIPIALCSSYFASSVLRTLLSLTCRFPCSMNSMS